MRRALAAVLAALSTVLVLAACGSTGPSAACLRAQRHEYALVRYEDATAAGYAAAGGSVAITYIAKESGDVAAAIGAMAAAGCPGDTKILEPTYGQ